MKRPHEGLSFPTGQSIAEIGEQPPSHFSHQPVDRSVVSFSSCGILPLLGCESEIELDLALAVLRDLGVVRPAAGVHRFMQKPTIEKIVDRSLFTDFFLVELGRRQRHTGIAARVGEVAHPTRGRLLFPGIRGGHARAREQQ
jgi:hypothetical protein